MKTTLSYQVSRKIDWIHMVNDLYVFKEDLYYDDKLINSIEGISTLKDLESLGTFDQIKPYKIDFKTKSGEKVKIPAVLYHDHFREVLRNYPFGYTEAEKSVDTNRIKKPFSYIKEHGYHVGVGVYYFYYGNHEFYDIDMNLIPQAIHFDYIVGGMHDGLYDLNAVLDILKKRSDIRWTDKPEIEKIPYYNADSYHKFCLDFYWTPTDDDFKKITLTDSKKDILSKIFNIEPKLKR